MPDETRSPKPPIAIPIAGDLVASRYRVEGVIGTGGMSVVVQARDERLGRSVALKLLRPSGENRESFAKRFLREARLIAQLQSDHVVRVLDVDASGEQPYLVMELLEGQTLAELLKNHGALPTAVAVDLLAQACRGIADAHERGIVHRDLKPSNLFLVPGTSGSQLVKVIDFGISKQLLGDLSDGHPDLTKTGQILGSPRYMSPEQLRGGSADMRTDVWALGVVLYELLAGHSPFDAPTTADTIARILSDAPPSLKALAPLTPPKLVSMVALCLAKDPAVRMQSARELLLELEAFLRSLAGVSVGQTSPDVALTRTDVVLQVAEQRPLLTRSRRQAVLALLSLGIAGVAGAGWYLREAKTPTLIGTGSGEPPQDHPVVTSAANLSASSHGDAPVTVRAVTVADAVDAGLGPHSAPSAGAKTASRPAPSPPPARLAASSSARSPDDALELGRRK